MRKALVFALLLVAAMASSEARPITLPDGTSGFFLERSDMENAVAAQDEATRWKEAYNKLADSNRTLLADFAKEHSRAEDALAEATKDDRFVTTAIVIGAIGVAVSFFAGLIVGAGL